MRISKAKAAENREKVLAAAARLFRERGLEGSGIDAVAEEAGLTHGAVYSHFRSKEELAAEALRQALQQSMDGWLGLTKGRAGAGAFETLLKAYVSRAHRDAPAAGCSVAAIGANVPRSAEAVREVFGDGVAQFIDVLTTVTEGATAADRRRTAIARAAAMLGAVVMSRAASADHALSDEILQAVRTELAMSATSSAGASGPRSA